MTRKLSSIVRWAPPAAARRARGVGKVNGASFPGKPLRVVIVEDNAADVANLERALLESRADALARVVDSESDFLDCLEESVDVILAGSPRSGFDGLTVLGKLKGLRRDIPLIFVSDSASEEKAVEAIRNGAADYLMKDRLTRLGPAIDRAVLERKLRADRQKAQQHVLSNEALKRAVLNSLTAHIAVLDRKGVIKATNDAWKRHARRPGSFGFRIWRRGEAYLSACRSRAMEGNVQAAEALRGIESVLSGKRLLFTMEYQLDETDSQAWYIMRVTPLESRHGGVVMAHENITALKRAEAARLETEDRYRNLVEKASDIIYRADLQGRLTYANPVALQLVSAQNDDVLGVRLFRFVRPDYVRTVEAWYGKQIIKRVPNTYFEFPLATAAHEEVWIGQNVQLLTERGTIVGLQAVARDITDRKRSEAELIRERDAAEEMSRLKSVFLANMSHEIRTPLSAIIGFAAVLQDEASGDQKKFATYIEGGARRLLNTLNSLLNLSALDAENVPLDIEIIDIVKEVRHKVEMLRPLASERDLTLRVVHEHDRQLASVDRALLDRILNNLIGNAIKFTEEGGVIVTVGQSGNHTLLEVSDTGIGISSAFLPQIFDEFKQESHGNARKFEGIGLGLAITKRLVELMGGDVTVESEQHRGSTFRVLLPVGDVSGVSLPSDKTPDDARGAKPNRVVLAVDDNPEIREILSLLVGDAATMVTAADADSARARAREQQFDLVLLDVNLASAQSGIDVLADLRKLAGYEAVPMVAITGYAMHGDRERLLEAGFDDYLSKPFVRQDLLDIMERNLTPDLVAA